MEIIAHGIDLVDFARIEKMVQQHSDKFLERVFTVNEQKYADTNKNNIEKLAGRFAVKEAVLKLLGTGWRGKIAWTDIEVINNDVGEPIVNITGEVEKIARQKGIKHISISITHTSNFAIASAVALRNIDEGK